MSGQTPLWLRTSLAESLHQVGATAPPQELEDAAEELLSLWGQSGRTIINGHYLAILFERLAELEGATSDPAILRLAAAFHGAETDPLCTFLDTKPQHAVPPLPDARARLEALGVPGETAARVAYLAGVLADTTPPTKDLDSQILWDSNLAVLAVSPQAYAKICRSLRTNSGLDDEHFLRARRKHIRRILSRPRLFLTPFAARWSDPVRENLGGELSQIDGRLAALAANGAGDSADSPDSLSDTASFTPSGPIVIRRSRTTEVSARPQAKETSRKSAPQKEEILAALKPSHNLDETSTLESIDDPFSHRRGRREQ